MTLGGRTRRMLVRLVSTLINDRRTHPPLSYPWLNALTWRVVRDDSIAARRPQYVWGIVHAAALAKTLGHASVMAVELGVAGGRGLVAMESAAAAASRLIGIDIEVAGFDTGAGLPGSQDPRDLPNLYGEGDYAMDVGALRAELAHADLRIGPIRDTVGPFVDGLQSPLGFVSCDVDLYTSTVEAFPLFDAPPERILPRVGVYMDDVMGMTFSEWNGERLAIREFNDRSATRKIDHIHGLRFDLPWPLSRAKWCDMMYLLHRFDHPDYTRKDNLIPSRSAPLRDPR